jgi:hypothetical protein
MSEVRREGEYSTGKARNTRGVVPRKTPMTKWALVGSEREASRRPRRDSRGFVCGAIASGHRYAVMIRGAWRVTV